LGIPQRLMGDSRNSKTLASFTAYCKKYPDQRFWQALCNWAGIGYVLSSSSPQPVKGDRVEDTWRWEGRVRDGQ
jgi:hypothetical protein